MMEDSCRDSRTLAHANQAVIGAACRPAACHQRAFRHGVRRAPQRFPRATRLLDFFVRELGPPVYNQGVRDASSYMQQKLADIEGEVTEVEK